MAAASTVPRWVRRRLALWQATIAREQAAEATSLNTFVLSLIKHADPYASQQTRQADLLMLATIEDRIDGNLFGSPAQRLRLRVTLGEAYRNRGQLIAAGRAYRRAIDDAGAGVPANDPHLLDAERAWPTPRRSRRRRTRTAWAAPSRSCGRWVLPARNC